MRRLAFLLLIGVTVLNGVLTRGVAAASDTQAEPDPFQEYADTDQRKLFVIETDEESARSSLDRISGDIDRGFASEDYVYKSRNHGLNGPLEKQKDQTLYY